MALSPPKAAPSGDLCIPYLGVFEMGTLACTSKSTCGSRAPVGDWFVRDCVNIELKSKVLVSWTQPKKELGLGCEKSLACIPHIL